MDNNNSTQDTTYLGFKKGPESNPGLFCTVAVGGLTRYSLRAYV